VLVDAIDPERLAVTEEYLVSLRQLACVDARLHETATLKAMNE
jgi:hypothetical protein